MGKSQSTVLVGPFTQILTFAKSRMKGALGNSDMGLIENAGILVEDGKISEIGNFEDLKRGYFGTIHNFESDFVGLPGIVDAHTHLLYAGSRHLDYSDRNQGISYLEIAKRGGGIWDTVEKTRDATSEILVEKTRKRIEKCLLNGITTIEIKTGYGLSVEEELRMLKSISKLANDSKADLIPTCLAAHIKPRDIAGSNKEYLDLLSNTLLPAIKAKNLSSRIDVFVEESAFTVDEARDYLRKAQKLGFDITIHGDQFTCGGSALAVELNAQSVDHLEASGKKEIDLLAASDTVSTVLPGASLGLGCNFAPARKLLDAGASVAIASDWNPGSAPMGDLLSQAAILGAFEKLSDAEVFAGITFRAAKALKLNDRGRLKPGMLADICAFEVSDYREILYHQGQLKPTYVWKSGIQI